MAPLHPEITYAERSSASEPEKNIIYFTINAPDVQDKYNLDIKPTEISFRAKAGDASNGVPEKEYSFDLQLWGEIIPEETKKVVTSRAIVLVLRKKEAQAEYWPRLTKEKPNRNWVKTDFSKWVDEDEQEGTEDLSAGMEGMEGMEGMGGMGGMGGMPGMGGMGGGMEGMDFSKLMEQMGGMGAMGNMGGAGSGPNFGDDDEEGSGDEGEDKPAEGEDKPSEDKAKASLDDVE
ncbi:hypothetical protein I312_105435 [Cryptococcus bacillisporus CA1280]|uniref:uncharacterized protein n=1 Tax=Cryptococcus bacillisporus CA1280 TaxID=1296109 RepID=UPI003367286B